VPLSMVQYVQFGVCRPAPVPNGQVWEHVPVPVHWHMVVAVLAVDDREAPPRRSGTSGSVGVPGVAPWRTLDGRPGASSRVTVVCAGSSCWRPEVQSRPVPVPGSGHRPRGASCGGRAPPRAVPDVLLNVRMLCHPHPEGSGRAPL